MVRGTRTALALVRAGAVTLLIVAVAYALAAGAAPATGSEIAFLRQPAVARLIVADGRASAAKLDSYGAFPGAAGGRKGGIAVEYQRHAFEIIAAGIAARHANLVGKGLLALEWGFAQAGADGSFPAERGGTDRKQHALHPKAVFLEAAAHSILLIRQSDVDRRFKDRTEALVPKLRLSARWMMNSQDLFKFFRRAGNTNQLFSAALALHKAGLVSGEKTLVDGARQRIDAILRLQTADGTFPEKAGFDSSYQSLSLDFLARYVLTLPPSQWRDTVTSALRKGVDRLLRAVRADGTVDTRSNTRTIACRRAVPGTHAKGRDIDILPRRLRLYGYVLNEPAKFDALSDKVLAAGQGFSHIAKCGGASPDEG
jgi:hypothetical protein